MQRWIALAACLLASGLAGCGGSDAPIEEPELIGEATPPRFPLELWELGVEGETILRIRVDETGAVDSIVVDASSGYAAFDEAAMESASGLRFTPARRNGEPVARWVRLPVRFSRDTVNDRATPIPGEE